MQVQGYLEHEKTSPPRSLQYAYAYGPTAVLGGWAFSYERGTPVGYRLDGARVRTGLRTWCHPGYREEIGILLPNNQRQHRTLQIQKDVLPYAMC